MLHDDIFEKTISYITDTRCELNLHGKAFYSFLAREKPVGFYFDETVQDSVDFRNTAIEFAKNELLTLPFPRCTFRAPNIMHNSPDFVIWAAERETERGIIYYTVTGKNNFTNGQIAVLPMSCRLTLAEAKVELDILDEKEPTWDDEQYIQKTGMMLLLLLMTINHPAYEKKEIIPSDKLQKARKKAGKQNLSKYIYINMKPEIKKSLSNSDGSIRRPHWRRGHVRKISCGRIVPVQACIVNFNGYSEPEKKIYISKSALLGELNDRPR